MHTVAAGACFLFTVSAPAHAGAATKTTKKAATATTERRPIPRLSTADAATYCDAATDIKAVLVDIRSKKAKLGAKAPASLFKQEIAADQSLAKISPKELSADFDTVTNYLTLFSKLADTKDTKELAKLSALMGSDETLSNYLDSTIRIEGFVRRTCGFPVGI